MNQLLQFAAALLTGAAVGYFFFGGLWWTVRHGLNAKRPVVVFASSLIVRFTVVAAAIFIFRDDWRALLLLLAGFIAARVLVVHQVAPNRWPL